MSHLNQMTDNELIAQALSMWANYIETRDVNLCAQDLQNMKKPVKALDEAQMESVLRLRKLSRVMKP
ncbi:hypothetical protein [Pseudomonas serbica]|jgi:hypothetical protein|uniref:hypothetical protein n=1 Tax=Pseudomonas serbica TaxID=2965074 RepID=UPI00237C2A9C|nr:hypothetical protein [Pseudomonas serbica]